MTARQGLRQNLGQFVILIVVNAFVGSMIGIEQTVVPLIGREEFGIESSAIILSFIASFGLVKAFLNLYAGSLAEKLGRKKVLMIGWLVGLPVPFMLLFAPDWNWIILANVMLGANQALAWSMTVNMKIDLVGAERRGLALGLNEFAGYISVAALGFATGYLASAYGLKPYPFYVGIAVVVIGSVLSATIVRDTRKFVEAETKDHESRHDDRNASLTFPQVFAQTSWKNRTLLAVSQAGLVNNLVFGVSWGLFTLYFASFQLGITEIGFLKALHPAIWGALQLATGPVSDRAGRKPLIYSGMLVQAAGIWAVLFSGPGFGWITGMSLLGIGSALAYPALLAAVSDVAHPRWRATSLGVYRFWRDLGFVFGAIGIGFLADLTDITSSIHSVAWIALASGIFVLVVMRETRKAGP